MHGNIIHSQMLTDFVFVHVLSEHISEHMLEPNRGKTVHWKGECIVFKYEEHPHTHFVKHAETIVMGIIERR